MIMSRHHCACVSDLGICCRTPLLGRWCFRVSDSTVHTQQNLHPSRAGYGITAHPCISSAQWR